MDRVLRLVAEGRLTAEEAGPILDALTMADTSTAGDPPSRDPRPAAEPERPTDAAARAIRVEVRESGRTVVNLRIPLSLGRVALTQVPGISQATSDRIREAIAGGIRGPIVDVDDGDDGVRISIE
jgi:hypothetical protein